MLSTAAGLWRALGDSLLSRPRAPAHAKLTGHTNHVWCLAVTDTTVFSGSADSTICAWDARSPHKLLATLNGHTAVVY